MVTRRNPASAPAALRSVMPCCEARHWGSGVGLLLWCYMGDPPQVEEGRGAEDVESKQIGHKGSRNDPAAAGVPNGPILSDRL